VFVVTWYLLIDSAIWNRQNILRKPQKLSTIVVRRTDNSLGTVIELQPKFFLLRALRVLRGEIYFLSISFGCGFAALGASWWYTSDQLLPKPETLSKAVFNFLAGQRFAEHFVAHVDPLAADFPDRFFHPL
jgi:hypothetical protein